MPEKIPLELLLKYSRQEVGVLKSDISELKDIINQKNQEIQKLSTKINNLQKLNHHRSPKVQVEDELKSLNKQLERIFRPGAIKRDKKLIALYKRGAKTYNYWFNGCKETLELLNKLRNIHFT